MTDAIHSMLSSLSALSLCAAEEGHALAQHAAGHTGPLKVQDLSFLWLIPFFPLVGAFINAALGYRLQRKFGKGAIHGIAVGAMVLSTLVGWVAFFKLLGLEPGERYLRDHLWNMFDVGGFTVNLSFGVDPLSMVMVLIITNIATLIHVYSTGYMADEKAYWRFFSYLNLFVFSMLLLVMGDNFALMFFGWEGVGLCSYLLISFWYTDLEKAKAGMKAFVVNRVGDLGFVIGLFILFWALKGGLPGLPAVPGAHPSLDFLELKNQFAFGGVGEQMAKLRLWGFPLLGLIGFFFFVGAAGKSAQLPLYVWLPDAMAGPTPVSALIHAATMVTAGVYMVARLNFLYAFSPEAMSVVAGVGALTALFAATIGFFQYDIKKVLAYSTVSQLGFMFIGVGVGAYWAGVYHLLTHAFFKACLFLGSGSVILGCHHEQDMRKMGGLKKYMPLTEKTYRYACIAISGFPIANGFFSKDEILWKAFSAGGNVLFPGWIIWLIGWIAATGTSFYMWRSYYMTFTGEYRGEHAHKDANHGHDEHGHHGGLPKESPRSMTWVLAALAIGCGLTILLGFWGPLAHQVPALTPALERWLEPSLPMALLTESRFLEYGPAWEWALMGASVAVAFLGWLLARTLYGPAAQGIPEADHKAAAALYALLFVPVILPVWLGNILVSLLNFDPKFAPPSVEAFHAFVFEKYKVDELYQATVIRLTMWLKDAAYWFDRTIIDGIVNFVPGVVRFVANIDGAFDKYVVDGMVNLVADGVLAAGRQVRRVQTGRIQTYLYGALVGALAFVGINYLFPF